MTESALPTTSREWRLLSRPVGWPKPEDFELAEAEIRQPGPGEVLVRNAYVSVDPYMRGRMSAAKSYVAPFELGKAMQGGAVGEVVASAAEGVSVGDHVLHFGGWREYATFDAKQAVKVDPEAAPLSTYLGVLGMTGLTAYAGLLRTGSFKEGDSVFVSGAVSAVGSQVGQIARLKGASRVIGSAKLRREGQAARRGVRLRRRLQLQERTRRRAAARGRSRRCRRLLRQRRRRPPRGGHRLAQREGPHRDLRHDLRLQQHRSRPPARRTSPASSRPAAVSRASWSATTTTFSRSSSGRSAAGSAPAS